MSQCWPDIGFSAIADGVFSVVVDGVFSVLVVYFQWQCCQCCVFSVVWEKKRDLLVSQYLHFVPHCNSALRLETRCSTLALVERSKGQRDPCCQETRRA